MTNLKLISDSELHQNTKKLVIRERELLATILNHLAEVDERRLYLKMGHGSLWDYCTLELNYSAGAASRRISTMKLLKELPVLEKPIQDGTLNLSTLSTVQSFLKQEKLNQKNYSNDEKLELVKKVENKSTRECLNILAAIAPESVIKPEKIKPINNTDVIMTIAVTQEFLKEVEELKNLISHELKIATVAEVLKLSVQKVLQGIKKKKGMVDPVRKVKPRSSTSGAGYEVKKSETTVINQNSSNQSQSPPFIEGALTAHSSTIEGALTAHSFIKEQSRYCSAETVRTTWQRAENYCEFIDSITKKRCSSRWKLEIDHVHPHSLGGSNNIENLRLLCKWHHGLFTEQVFGKYRVSKKRSEYKTTRTTL